MPRTVNVEGTQNARLRKAMLLHMSVGRSEIHPQRSHQILRLSPMGIVLLCPRHSSQRLLKLSRCDPTFKSSFTQMMAQIPPARSGRSIGVDACCKSDAFCLNHSQQAGGSESLTAQQHTSKSKGQLLKSRNPCCFHLLCEKERTSSTGIL